MRSLLLVACVASGLSLTALAGDGYDPRPNSGVLSMAFQADGKLLVGGHFTNMVGVGGPDNYPRTHLARLNVNGSVDTDFWPAPDGDVSVIVVQPDGKILIGGNFQNVTPSPSGSATPRTGIARLNPDGSLDLTFAPTIATTSISGYAATNDAAIYAIAVQPDGKILIGGNFQSVMGTSDTTATTCANIVRLNADGSIDTSFDVKTNGLVSAITLQDDGGIVIGGGFTNVKPTGTTDYTARGYAARLTSAGVLDTFNPTFNNMVNAILVQPDGSMVFGGQFTSANLNDTTASTDTTYDRLFIARYTAAGMLDTSFYPAFSNTVKTMTLQKDGKILVGGLFTQVFSAVKTGGVSSYYLGRINPDGSADSTFFADLGQYSTSVLALPDGKILVGGWFTTVDTGSPMVQPPIPYLARLYSDGSVDTDWMPGTSAPSIAASAIYPDGKSMIISGSVGSLGGITFHGLFRIKADGTVDPDFKNPKITGTGINQITILSDSRILIAGAFTAVNDTTCSNIAILKADGSLDTSFKTDTISSTIFSVAVQSDGRFLVGGNFTTIGTTTRNFIARLGTDGTLDTTYNPSCGNSVYVVKILADGRTLLGGAFTSIEPNANSKNYRLVNYLVCLNSDGTYDSSFIPAFNGTVYSIEQQTDGSVLVGGNFSYVYTKAASNSVERNCLVRLDSKGYLDSTFFTNIVGYVSLIKLQSDGKMIITGAISKVNDIFRNIIARLNTDGSLDTAYNPNILNGGISTMMLQSDGSLVVTGNFNSMQPTGYKLPIERPGLAHILTDGSVDTAYSIQLPSSLIGEADVVTTTSTGSMLVGGSFSNLAGSPSANLIRIGANGLTDTTFNPNPNGRVRSLLEIPIQSQTTVFANRFAWYNSNLSPRVAASNQNFEDDGGRIYNCLPLADGSVIIAGRFNIDTASTTIMNLAHIKADGTVDTSFAPQPNNFVNDIKRLSDGSYVIGGGFTSVNGNTHMYLAHIYADGTVDSAFTPAPSASVETIAVQSDGNILIGGNFTSVTGTDNTSYAMTYYGRIKMATGNPDSSYTITLDSSVTSIAIQSDGKVLIGGLFTVVTPSSATATTQRLRMARINTDATLDTSFDPSFNGQVLCTLLQSDGKILVAGAFTNQQPGAAANAAAISAAQTAGTTVPDTVPYYYNAYLVRLNSDGTVDSSFSPVQPSGYLNRIALASDGSVLLAGQFLYLGTTQQPFVGRLTSTGALDTTFKLDANAPVYAVGISPIDNSIIFGGKLSYLDHDSMVLAAGEFTNIGNQDQSYIAALSRNGQYISTFVTSVDGVVNATAKQGDAVLLAGAFKKVSGKSRPYLARTGLDGSLDDSFQPNPDGEVKAMAVLPDGRVLIAGSFTHIGSASAQGIACIKVDGSLDTSFNSSVTGDVSALAFDETGKVLVGGSFTAVAGASKSYIARLTSTGGLDTSFTTTTDGPVYAVAPVVGSRVYIGGLFTKVNGVSRSNFAIVSGSDGSYIKDSDKSSPNAAVRSMAILNDSKVVLGGSFTRYNDDSHYLVARFNPGYQLRQSLTVNAARDTLTWYRPAGSCLLNNVSFEYSTDGITWTSLGSPTISADSTTVTQSGLSLPIQTSFFLKAKGYSNVSQGGSASMSTDIWQFYLQSVSIPSQTTTVAVKGNAMSLGGVTSRTSLSYSSTDLPAGLSIDSSTGRIYGTPTTTGNYLVHVHYADLFTSGNYTLSIIVSASSGNSSAGNDVQRLVAYSTLGVSSTTNPLIIGFIVRGDASMPVLLRAVGPSLPSSVSNHMATPKGALYQITSSGTVKVLEVTAWSDSSGTLAQTTARVGAQPLATGSKDVSTIAQLAPGAYSWVITDSGNASGYVLAEVYDANAVGALNASRLADCSTRGYVNVTDHLIAGYAIEGNSQLRTLLRAVGPSMGVNLDLLNNPQATLRLADGSNTVIAQNDDWQTQSTVNSGWQVATAAEIASYTSTIGLASFPAGSKDSALLLTLPAGNYSFDVTSADTDAGNVMLEVYLP